MFEDDEKLVVKYVGQKELDRARNMKDIYLKKTWFIHQICRVCNTIGQLQARQMRCKSDKSELYKELNKIILNCENIISILKCELLSI